MPKPLKGFSNAVRKGGVFGHRKYGTYVFTHLTLPEQWVTIVWRSVGFVSRQSVVGKEKRNGKKQLAFVCLLARTTE